MLTPILSSSRSEAVALQLRGQVARARPQLVRGAHRPEGIVLVDRGQPEDGRHGPAPVIASTLPP